MSGKLAAPNIICLGISHRTAPVEVREQFAVTPGRMDEVCAMFKQAANLDEAVVLSTCNRVEFYGSGHSIMATDDKLDGFLASYAAAGNREIAEFYRYDFPYSAEHLFRVACGLDSMIVGETEITGQVKSAYKFAAGQGHTGRYLNRLFQRTFQVVKEARTKTGINRGAVSVGSVAVDLAGRIFNDLQDCRVMVVGAGENSERTMRSLVSRGVSDVLVANRSVERAVALAESFDGQAIPLTEWESKIPEVDILIASTAAPHYIIDKARLEPRLSSRRDRPLFIIDIAVPRDVAPEVNALDGIYLYDIDSLQALANNSLQERRLQAGLCDEVVRDHAAAFASWMDGRSRRKQRSPANNGNVFSKEARA